MIVQCTTNFFEEFTQVLPEIVLYNGIGDTAKVDEDSSNK